MGGQQRCRHGESAHLCPWCSYENGKEDGRKAERARIVVLARAMAAEHEAEGKAADEEGANISSDRAWSARDALLELVKRVEGG